MTKKEMQQKLRDHNLGHVKVLDKDTVRTSVDGAQEIFHRQDTYGGHPMSGLAIYGGVYGDHRMISAIYDDMQTAFSLIKN